MNWSFLQSKFFYLNIIALGVLVLEYFVANQMFTQFLPWEGLAIVVLNAIAGMIKTQEVKALKGQLRRMGVLVK